MDDLSVKKQDKALIHAARARNIKTVLIDPKDTAIESAQFRYGLVGPADCIKVFCLLNDALLFTLTLFGV